MGILNIESKENIGVRKGLFSIDASFAVVILLLMSYLFFMILDSLNSSLGLLQQRQKTASLVVFSDELVRREAAVSTNTEVISNRISIPALEEYFERHLSVSNFSAYGFGKVVVSVFGIDGNLYFSREVAFSDPVSGNVFCIDRLVVVSDSEKSGVMKVCVS